MKKVFKWIALILSLFLLLLTVIIVVVTWFVFTPSKLTPIVKSQVAKYMTCESQIGEVELTFFSTFPHFGLKVNKFALFNHSPKVKNDTLMHADFFVGVIDLAAYWKNNELVLNELKLKNGSLNVSVDSLGRTNYDIFKADTVAVQEQADTGFHRIQLEKVELENFNLKYTDRTMKLQSIIQNLDAELSGKMISDQIETQINITGGNISTSYDGIEYLKNASIKVKTLTQINLAKQLVEFGNSEATVNNLSLTFSGTVENDSQHNRMISDLKYQFKSLPIPQIMALVPATYESYFKDIKAFEGLLSSNGTIKGVYSDSLMPMMDLHLVLENGLLQYNGLPFPLSKMNGDISIFTDFTNDELSYVHIDRFSAVTPESDFQTRGNITHLFTNIYLDLKSEGTLTLKEFKAFLPTEPKMEVSGKASGKVISVFSMEQLDKMQFDRMKFDGSVHLTDFNALYDTITLKTDDSNVDFEMPAMHASSKKTEFVSAKIKSKNLQVSTLHNTNARFENAWIAFETSNVMDSTRIPDVICSFKLDSLSGSMDTIRFAVQRPVGNFAMMPQKTKVLQPEIDLSLNSETLLASLGSDKNRMNHIQLKAHIVDDPILSNFKIQYSGENLEMAMGADSARMNRIEMEADVTNDQSQKDVFLQWQAKGFLNVEKGRISMSSLKYPLDIPSIKMNFDPEVFDIKDSKLKIDKSDFSLEGKLSNVLSYFRKDSLLRGNFNFLSTNTDLPQLMLLTSGLGDSKSDSIKKTSVKTDETSTGPYMVPKGIDISLNVDIARANYGKGAATDMKGKFRVKDGLMVLDNFKFITPAAKMQLTTMYRTPRKNHLFIGIEFHMLDVEISELLKIIPDVDSIMPMLRSFSGKGEFHMAAETYLDSLYNPKKSTIRGAASIKGQDLVLMDGETFSEIAKTLRFSKKTFNKVDSLSAEFTVFKQEIDVYPFLIVMDKYKGVVAGRHNMDMSFDYHISVVDSPLPIKFGIDIKGTMDDMKYRPAKCRYPEFYRPVARGELKNSQLELSRMIRESLINKIDRN